MNLLSLGRRIEKLKEDGDGDGFVPLLPPFTNPLSHLFLLL